MFMCDHIDHQDLISSLIYSQWNGTEIILLHLVASTELLINTWSSKL
jgi:hypothetical protein